MRALVGDPSLEIFQPLEHTKICGVNPALIPPRTITFFITILPATSRLIEPM